jgi:hypothetical protein
MLMIFLRKFYVNGKDYGIDYLLMVAAFSVVLFFMSLTKTYAIEDEAGLEELKSKEGFTYDEDAGLQYTYGDFKWTTWAFAERLFWFTGKPSWRRARQGMEFQFPRFEKNIFGSRLRTTFFYEVDFVNNDFFRRATGRVKIWENLFITLQNADDPNKFRLLFGENTHILSREDNLSSGNLTTINRSLILEEHGSTNNFGTQFGIQFQALVTPQTLLQFSLQDNRGSLNQDDPKYNVPNGFAAKITHAVIQNNSTHQKLNVGFAVDYTKDIGDKNYSLLSAIDLTPLGSVRAAGDKSTLEANADYAGLLFNKDYSLEFETIYSHFSGSDLDVSGGYLQAQYLLFDSARYGDLVPFVRYDIVNVSADDSSAFQQALRTGFNFNLPYMRKHVNLHFEYARNMVSGSKEIITGDRDSDEFKIELRISTGRYLRF